MGGGRTCVAVCGYPSLFVRILSVKQEVRTRSCTTVTVLVHFCDSGRAVSRVPQDKLEELQALIGVALKTKNGSLATLQRITGKSMVVIQPAA